MKRCGVGILLFAIALAPVAAFEVGGQFLIGNLGFSDTREPTDTDYPVEYPWGLSLYGSQQVTDELAIDLGFFSDPILNNISYTLLTYKQDFFEIGVGPFFGFFNSETSILRPGISTAVRIDLPGLLFFSFRADSTIGGRLVQEGDYLQERSDVSVGFYVFNALASFNILTKNYTSLTADNEVVDSIARYMFKTDIYQKNVPYRVILSFGYQNRTRSYIDTITRDTIDHTLNSIIIGTRVDVQLAKFLWFETDLESSVFSFGSVGTALLELPETDSGTYLFKLTTGFRFNIDTLLANRGIQLGQTDENP